MKIFSNDLLQEILAVEAVEIEKSLLTDKKTTINIVAQQLWEGSNSIFSHMPDWLKNALDFDGVNGIRDILDEFIHKDVRTVIFYIPKTTVREIRKRLTKVSSDTVSETIEDYIISKSEGIENLIVYNLSDEHENIKNIFNIPLLKKEFDKDSKGDEKIYLLGLKQNLSMSNEIQFYLNNTPLREEGGLILGNSPILRHQLKKGFINIFLDGDVEIEFYNTNRFTSIDSLINEDLEDVINGEAVPIDLEDQNSPFILESQRDNNLVFSTEIDLTIKEENASSSSSDSSLKSIVTEVRMESFFVPKTKDLERVNFLLINKNGQKVLAGGQYYAGLIDCDVIAEIVFDLKEEHFIVTNCSKENLSFVNYDDFWRLEGAISSPIKHQDSEYSAGIYTEILTAPSSLSVDEDIVTQIRDVDEVLKEGESTVFKLPKIDFNDSSILFDNSGVLIQYTALHIKEFKQELSLHRTTSKISSTGTIIDCFIEQKPLSRGEYLYGARSYSDGSSTILGNLLSSQPIVLKHTPKGLEIDASSLIARDRRFKVQISASSNKYILEHGKKRETIKKQDIDDLLIEVFMGDRANPRISFSINMI